MAVDPRHTLGFLAGGYRNVAQLKGIELPQRETSVTYESLVIGWDAADWKVVMPLLQSGKMPALAGLMHGGVHANLATLDPPISPMLWTSIITGNWPSQHGIHGFTEIHQGSVRAVRGSSVKLPTYLDYLEQANIPATSVAWWPSHPAAPSALGGYRISNLAASESGQWLEEGIHPSEHVELLASLLFQPEEIPAQAVSSFFPNMELNGEDAVVRSVLKILTHALNVHTLATFALDHGPGGHASIYFDALDHFMHLGMKYMPPRMEGVSEIDFAHYHHIVEAAYRLHDLFLGEYLEKLAPTGHALLLSDHGFESGSERINQLPGHAGAPALEHRHFGMFVGSGPLFKPNDGWSGMNLLDIAPILLALHGLDIPESMAGKRPVGLRTTPLRTPSTLRGKTTAERITLDDEELLESLVDLGYLEENHIVSAEGRILENIYYLARSVRAEGRLDKAWNILSQINLQADSPPRYLQLAASILADSGSYDRLNELLSNYPQRSESLIWTYYEQLVAAHKGGSIQVPDLLFQHPSSKAAILWARLLWKAQMWEPLEQWLALAPNTVDALNLKVRARIRQHNWEEALEAALESAQLLVHQPFVHGALALIFGKLNMPEEQAAARALQRQMLGVQESVKPLFIVTGAPRSGTSLTMQLLQNLGIPAVTDGERGADSFNAHGYLEHEAVKSWTLTEQWLKDKRGKAVKIVHPLLAQAPLPIGPKVVIEITRNWSSILQSQRFMKGQTEAPLGWSEQKQWETEAEQARLQLELDPHLRWIRLSYEEVLKSVEIGQVTPALEQSLSELGDLCGSVVDISVLKAVVNPSLRRF